MTSARDRLAQPSLRPASPSAADASGLLIVDDDLAFADTLASEFRDRGYSVECLEGLDRVHTFDLAPFRFAIVDLRLRDASGLDVISWIKEHAAEIRVVVLTGYGSLETAIEARKLGASQYLMKPVDIDTLERALLDESSEGEEMPIPPELQSPHGDEGT